MYSMGDAFIRDYLDREDTNQVWIAKEFVKFSERCFLGDFCLHGVVVHVAIVSGS